MQLNLCDLDKYTNEEINFFRCLTTGKHERVKELVDNNQKLLSTIFLKIDTSRRERRSRSTYQITEYADRRMTALHIARAKNDLKMMKILLTYQEARSGLYTNDKYGLTPLHSFLSYSLPEPDLASKEISKEFEIVKFISAQVDISSILGNSESSPLVWGYKDKPQCLIFLIDSIRKKALKDLTSVLNSYFYGDITSIISGYHISFDLDKFLNQKPESSGSVLYLIFNELLKSPIPKVLEARDQALVQCANILIDHGAELVDASEKRYLGLEEPEEPFEGPTLDRIKALKTQENPLAEELFKKILSSDERQQKPQKKPQEKSCCIS